MQKSLLPFLSLLLVIWGCGEAGIQSDISKNIEIDPIEVSIPVVPGYMGDTPPTNSNSGVIDISDNEFGEYLEDSESFTINEITYKIEGFNPVNEADLEVEIAISIEGGPDMQLLTTLIPDLQDINPNVAQDLYLKTSPGNVNQSTITELEQALKNGQSFEMNMVLTGRDVDIALNSPANVEFSIQFFFDVTTRIQLD